MRLELHHLIADNLALKPIRVCFLDLSLYSSSSSSPSLSSSSPSPYFHHHYYHHHRRRRLLFVFVLSTCSCSCGSCRSDSYNYSCCSCCSCSCCFCFRYSSDTIANTSSNFSVDVYACILSVLILAYLNHGGEDSRRSHEKSLVLYFSRSLFFIVVNLTSTCILFTARVVVPLRYFIIAIILFSFRPCPFHISITFHYYTEFSLLSICVGDLFLASQ